MKTGRQPSSRISHRRAVLLITTLLAVSTWATSTLAQCLPAPPGLVGWWRAEEDAMDSVSTNHGMLQGNVTFSAGKAGLALNLNGTNASVRVPASASLDVGAGGGLTLEGWIKPADVSVQRPIFQWNAPSGYGVQFWISVSSPASLYGNLRDTGFQHHTVVSPSGSLAPNVHQHVALTYQKSSGMAVIWLNGVVVGAANLGVFTPLTTGDLYAGTTGDLGGQEGGPLRFAGQLDELSVYNRALGTNEIAAIYGAGSAGKCAPVEPPACDLPDGIAAWWKAENNALDTIGANHGSLMGSVTYTNGQSGQSFQFDGASFVQVPDSPSLHFTNSMTVEAWINLSTFGGANSREIVSKYGGPIPNQYEFTFAIDPAFQTAYFIVNSTNSFAVVRSSKTIPLNQWVHLAGTYDGNSVKIYVNGQEDGATPFTQTIAVNNNPLVIGCTLQNNSFPTSFFNGLIDEVSLYHRVLGSNEIAAIYAAGSAGKCGPPTEVTSWEAASAFATNANPNGAWSYGYSTTLGGAFTPHASRGMTTGIEYWRTDFYGNNPGAYHNPVTANITNITVILKPNQLALHPGDAGEFSLLRFTTPKAGTYRVQGSFVGADTHGTTTDAHVLLASGSIWDALITGYEAVSAKAFDSTLGLNAGDKLDFAVGNGGNGFYYDATGISVRISLITSNSPIAPPLITDFAPKTAKAGAVVQLTGNNFSPVAASNIVYFGAVRATVTTASLTSLTVAVPTGATYAPPTVTVGGLTAQATASFTPTFAGDGPINGASFAPRVNLASGDGPIQTVIADLDGDGKPDLAVTDDYAGTLSLYRNLGVPGMLTASSFGSRVVIPASTAGYSPYMLVAADVDGDGKLDLVTTDVQANTVSVFRNQSAPGSLSPSSFAPFVSFAVGTGPRQLAVVDLDADGRPEIVSANYDSSTVSVLRNTATAGQITASSFAPKFDLTAGAGTHGVAVADLDGDGRPDLVTANHNGATVSLFRNLGNGPLSPGSFASEVQIPAPSSAHFLRVADLDGDGKLDLLLTSYLSVPLTVYRNQSTVGVLNPASFAAGVGFALSGRGHTISAGDLNGDGKVDLAVDTEIGDSVALLQNLATPGSFTSASLAARVDLSTGWNAWGSSVGDLDGDGRPDVVVANAYDDTLSLYRNVGAAPPNIVQNPTNRTVIAGSPTTFSVGVTGSTPLAYQWEFNEAPIPGATNASYSIAAVQESQAGNYRLIVTNHLGSAASSPALLTVLPPPPVPVIYSFAPGKAKAGEAVQLVGTNFSPVAASNIVYFGAVRALVVAASPTSLTVVAPSGATYAPPSVTVAGLSGQAPTPFLPTYDGSQIVNSSSFAPKVDFTASSPQATVATGDLDGDGKPDMVVGNYNASSISVYRNISSNGIINATSFAPRVWIPISSLPLGSMPYVSLADVDGDGKLDILVANNGNGRGDTISIFRNISVPGSLTAASFAPRVNYTTPMGPLKIAAGDLDGDGRTDLAVSAASSRVVSLFRNLGSPGIISLNTFAARVDLEPNLVDRDLALADLDGDGKLDIVVTHFSGGTVSLLRNIATRGSLTTNSFQPKVTLASGGAYNLAIGDLDGDGKLDLAVDNRPSSIGVFRNIGSPGSLSSNSFAAKVSFPVGGEPYMVAIGDVDGDGKPDLAASVLNLNSVAVLHNTALPGVISSNSFAARVLFATGASPRNVVLGDLDADGRPDLAVANLSSSFVSVLKNTTLLPAPPTFTQQPVSQSVVLGDLVTFSANATGVPLPQYQWQFNGDNIAGATNKSLILQDAQLAQQGSYAVIISNPSGVTPSSNAVLTVTIPTCTPAPAGLVGWWPGEGGGEDAVAGHNGVLGSGVAFGPGKVGQAFQHSPSSAGVKIPAASALDVGAGEGFTIECWIRPQDLMASPLLEWNNGSTYGVHFWVGGFSGPGTLFINLVDSSGGHHYLQSAGGVVKSNLLQHVATTYDKASGVTKLFCNGSVVAQTTLGSLTPNTAWDLFIGRRPAGTDVNSFIGDLDELSVYNRALATNEIAAIYAARGAGKCPLPPTILAVTPPSWYVNEGATVAFTATAAGSPPLTYQWQHNGTDLGGTTSPMLTLSNVVYAQGGNYAVVVTGPGGATTSSNVVLRVNRAPVASVDATELLLISPNGANAVAVLDGSQSSDPDGDALSYAWFITGESNALATGVVAVTSLPVGSNSLTLVVSDGMAEGAHPFAIEAITTAQAVDRLAALVASSTANPQPLLASLRAALAAIDRSQPATAINQLQAFQNKVQAQVAPHDPILAAQLIAEAQAIIDALNGGGEAAPLRIEITSITKGGQGKPHLKIRGLTGRTHVVETSTNGVDWVKIGVASASAGSGFEFDDLHAPETGARFYRVLSPK